MNRKDLVAGIAYIEQIRARLGEMAQEMRDQLAADARAEYEEQGTAATHRIPQVAVLSTSVSRRAVVVTDPRAWARWVASRYPDEVEPAVRQSWQRAFLARVEDDDGTVCDPKTGEVIPGLSVRPGGEFRGISLTVSGEAKGLFAEMADRMVRRMIITSDLVLPALRELEAGDQAA